MKGKCDMLMPKGMMDKVNGDMGMKYRGKKGKKGKKEEMKGMRGKPGMAVVIAVGKVKKSPSKKKK